MAAVGALKEPGELVLFVCAELIQVEEGNAEAIDYRFNNSSITLWGSNSSL